MANLIARQVVSAYAPGVSQKTVMQLIAAANQRVKIREIGISFAGTTNTNAPVLVTGMLQTTAGTKSSGTPVPIDGDVVEAIQTAASITFTGAEPTYSSILFAWYVHPQTGIILPLSTINPIVLKGGTRFGLTVTDANNTTLSAYIEFEE